MNEKQFYHTALEDALLNGSRLKKRIDAAIDRAPNARAGQTQRSHQTRKDAVRTWIAVPAAAVLLLVTVSMGVLVIAHNRDSDEHAAAQPDQTKLQQTLTPSVTPEPNPTEEPNVLYAVTPTPAPLYTQEPTAWPYPSDEDLFVPEVTLQPTPTPAGSAMPTPEPTSAHEYTPQVFENEQKETIRFADMELFFAGWDTVSVELYSIRLAVDPTTHAVTVTDGRRTSEDITAHIEPEPVGLKRAILMQLDPDKPQRDLILVIAVENGTYRTVVMRPEDDALVIIKELDGECVLDGYSLLRFEQTALLGDGTGWRRCSGEALTPESDWCVCESPSAISLNHVHWLHVTRDLPCTIDGSPAVIEAGTSLFRTRFNEMESSVEVCTENGTIALIVFDAPDSYTIAGVDQAEYFEDLPLSN